MQNEGVGKEMETTANEEQREVHEFGYMRIAFFNRAFLTK